MKIKGKIIQLIKPSEIKSFMSYKESPIHIFEDTHYILRIAKEDYPNNTFIKKIIYNFKHRKEIVQWTVAVKEYKGKEGDSIELDCKSQYTKTDIYIVDDTVE